MNQVQHLIALGRALSPNEELTDKIDLAYNRNPWFTIPFLTEAVDAIRTTMLDEAKLNAWLSQYELHPVNKTLGLIFAGNLPLVGFHDFLVGYVAGCKLKIKLSSKDDVLFPYLLSLLAQTDTSLDEQVTLVNKLEDFDAVIATGSDNTNRYFEYYFRNHPKVLRKNRNSVAVLTGAETKEELNALGKDIFTYFGFGCRNVSKVFVPEGYVFNAFFEAIENDFAWLHHHTKYMNNYDYNRTLLLMNSVPHLSNNFLMISENESLASPISVLHYETYKNVEELQAKMLMHKDKIQCVVSRKSALTDGFSPIPFGHTQQPGLSDYADGVDTLKFLLELAAN